MGTWERVFLEMSRGDRRVWCGVRDAVRACDSDFGSELNVLTALLDLSLGG